MDMLIQLGLKTYKIVGLYENVIVLLAPIEELPHHPPDAVKLINPSAQEWILALEQAQKDLIPLVVIYSTEYNPDLFKP